MNDEFMKRRRMEESPNLLFDLIKSNRETTSQILKFLSYTDIVDLCAADETPKVQICGDLDDKLLSQFLDKALLGSRDLDTLVDEFEKQFFSDFWEARLRDEFGMSVDPTLDWHSSRAVSEWSGRAIEFVIEERRKEFIVKLRHLASSYPDNDRRLALLSSPHLGLRLAKLITFRSLYQEFYTSDTFNEISGDMGSDPAPLLYASVQVSLLSLLPHGASARHPFHDLVLMPTAVALFVRERTGRWSNLLDTMPLNFVYHIETFEKKYSWTHCFDCTRPLATQEFHRAYFSLSEISTGNALALVFKINNLSHYVVVLGRDAIWGAKLDIHRYLPFGKKSSVSERGDSVFIFSNFRNSLDCWVLNREVHASEQMFRSFYQAVNPTTRVSLHPDPIDFSFIVVSDDFYRLGDTFSRWKLNFDDAPARLFSDAALTGATQQLDLFQLYNSAENLFFDTEANAIVFRKFIFPFSYQGDDAFSVGYIRIQFMNTVGKYWQNDDYTFSFKKITYEASYFFHEMINQFAEDFITFAKDDIIFGQNQHPESTHFLLNLKTFSFSQFTKPFLLYANKIKIPIMRYLRSNVFEIMTPSSVEQIYFYDSAAGDTTKVHFASASRQT